MSIVAQVDTNLYSLLWDIVILVSRSSVFGTNKVSISYFTPTSWLCLKSPLIPYISPHLLQFGSEAFFFHLAISFISNFSTALRPSCMRPLRITRISLVYCYKEVATWIFETRWGSSWGPAHWGCIICPRIGILVISKFSDDSYYLLLQIYARFVLFCLVRKDSFALRWERGGEGVAAILWRARIRMILFDKVEATQDSSCWK